MKKNLKKLFVFTLILFFTISICGPVASAKSKININTASVEELTKLDNIGPKKAGDIVKYREVTPFKTVDEITQVKGIGKKTFERIKDLITVGVAAEKG